MRIVEAPQTIWERRQILLMAICILVEPCTHGLSRAVSPCLHCSRFESRMRHGIDCKYRWFDDPHIVLEPISIVAVFHYIY
jgi:hypothetical protein